MRQDGKEEASSIKAGGQQGAFDRGGKEDMAPPLRPGKGQRRGAQALALLWQQAAHQQRRLVRRALEHGGQSCSQAGAGQRHQLPLLCRERQAGGEGQAQ